LAGPERPDSQPGRRKAGEQPGHLLEDVEERDRAVAAQVVRHDLTSILVVIMAAGPAAAAQLIQDPHDSPWAYDTRAMKIWRNNNGYVEMAMSSNTYNAGAHWNGLSFLMDTRGAGYADYRVDWDFQGDGDGWSQLALYRVNGSDYINRLSCNGLDVKATKKNGWVNVYVWVPRGCMWINKNIGVRGYTWDWFRYHSDGSPARGYYDATPNRGMAR
jgi:hypothetical protein